MSVQANNYTGYYEQSSFGTLEIVTLAEDLKFSTFEDIEGKFYFKMITPKVDTSKTSKPKDSLSRNGQYNTSNFVKLNIPSNVLMGAIKPKMINCGIDPDTGCLKPGLRGYKLLYTKDLDSKTGKYVIKKGTSFLVEMVGGDMDIDSARIISIAESIDAEE
jgi:hypothetical protein